MALKKGVKVAVRTDTGIPFNRFDIGTAHGIELLVSSGASNAQTLFGTTRYTTELLRIDGDYGTLEEAKYAVLLLFDKNLLADVGIIKNGHKEVFQKGKKIN